MGKDLRSFIEDLRVDDKDDIINVRKSVDPKFEATTVLRKLELEGKEPLVIFDNPKNLYGEDASMPLLFNAFSTRKKLCTALDLSHDDFQVKLPLELTSRFSNKIKPIQVSIGEAPVKEVVIKGDSLDLFKFPIPTHHSLDGGPYILGGTTVTRNLTNGNYNLAMIRFHVKDKNTTAIHAEPHHHTGMIVQQHREAGTKCPFAIVIGHHPTFFLGSLWEGAFGNDEYEVASGVMKEPLRLVPSETWGEELMVPADAEIIIEGWIDPEKMIEEGPLGEHTRYYKSVLGGVVKIQYDPEVKVTAITMRKKPIFQSLFIGHSEHALIGAIPKEAVIYERVKTVSPGLKAVHLTPAGVGRYICYISLKQRVTGEVKDAIMATFTGDWHIKYVVAVDEDVDIFSDSEVLWAIALRTQARRDFFIIPDAMGATLDPTVDSKKPYTDKMGIDATKPFGEPFSDVCEVPIDMLNNMKLEDYLE